MTQPSYVCCAERQNLPKGCRGLMVFDCERNLLVCNRCARVAAPEPNA